MPKISVTVRKSVHAGRDALADRSLEKISPAAFRGRVGGDGAGGGQNAVYGNTMAEFRSDFFQGKREAYEQKYSLTRPRH
ncbi:hypothetical protein [Novibacillus thermophilus]|uniref:Uncharacterized protein n=1 Tax=Novibacillus thermophilus TaxID=1471761 RepID=A0A1U9K9L0_9BACL|nr:hypothetical protein [Novibacillus thermophilus]AQS56745.1 hypothetical protein B0W44_14315 [Novibacillus thermophilus]